MFVCVCVHTCVYVFMENFLFAHIYILHNGDYKKNKHVPIPHHTA